MSEIDEAHISQQCRATPGCTGGLKYDSVRHVGGVNDKGGWVVKCDVCQMPYSVAIAGDVNESRPRSGAQWLATWEVDHDNKERVLAEYGLSS
jgi:hypothetical protein